MELAAFQFSGVVSFRCVKLIDIFFQCFLFLLVVWLICLFLSTPSTGCAPPGAPSRMWVFSLCGRFSFSSIFFRRRLIKAASPNVNNIPLPEFYFTSWCSQTFSSQLSSRLIDVFNSWSRKWYNIIWTLFSAIDQGDNARHQVKQVREKLGCLCGQWPVKRLSLACCLLLLRNKSRKFIVHSFP